MDGMKNAPNLHSDLDRGRRRWIIGMAAAGAAVAASSFWTPSANAGWIGEPPPIGTQSAGTQMFLKVDQARVIASFQKSYVSEIRRGLRDERISASAIRANGSLITYTVRDTSNVTRAMELLKAIAPRVDISRDGRELRVRFDENLYRRMQADALMKTYNSFQDGNLKYQVESFYGPKVRAYIHESGCIRLDGIDPSDTRKTRSEHIGLPLSAEIVPLFPELPAKADGLDEGFSLMRLKQKRKSSQFSDPGMNVLEELQNAPVTTYHPRALNIDNQESKSHVIAGNPLVSQYNFVDAQAAHEFGKQTVTLDLDLEGEGRIARYLPAVESRRFAFAVDGVVVALIEKISVSGRRVMLWGGYSSHEAEDFAAFIRALAVSPSLLSAEACPMVDRR